MGAAVSTCCALPITSYGTTTRGGARVATGDFHYPEHLLGWKTLLPSRHDEAAVVDYLRSRRPVFLTRLEADTALAA